MKTRLQRRTLLKASGIAVALPLLESMSPSFGGEQEEPPRRMVLICSTLGLHPPSLFPKTPGRDYENTEYLSLLKEHRQDFTLFSGLSHPDQNGKQPHDTELTWLTSARNPGLAGFKNSISVDQFAARTLGTVTRFPSIALSSNGRKSQSYTSNGVMIPAEDRPSSLFANLFLEGTPHEIRRTRRRLADGRSILDSVAEQTRSLNRIASLKDRRQLDEYYEAIREAETELVERQSWLDRPKPKIDEDPPHDIADPADLIGRTKAMLNLIPLIIQTDSSRIVTLVIKDHLVVPKINGVTAEHHNLSHHGRDPDKIKQLKIIETAILSSFAEFLTRMAKLSESEGRLLDKTSVLFGSNLGNANSHDPRNLPIFVAGGGYEHGSYVAHDADSNTPLCNLFVNLLNNTGIDSERFGTSSGTLQF
ncbi:DUF1552 domain-containing protein [Rubripirellula sp.]|jgi:hypothetical protein|nr:DUF1552 domain-containing protein [Rubripirellula sp.]